MGVCIASKAIISNAIATKHKIAYFFLFDFFMDCHAHFICSQNKRSAVSLENKRSAVSLENKRSAVSLVMTEIFVFALLAMEAFALLAVAFLSFAVANFA